MSLINKMLQELDARRSDVSSTGQYGQQVRAVPERRGIHPAWWVALALGIALSGVLAWILLQPPAVNAPGAHLPLKLDAGLTNNLPASQPISASQTAAPAATNPTAVNVPSTPAGTNPQIVTQSQEAIPASPAALISATEKQPQVEPGKPILEPKRPGAEKPVSTESEKRMPEPRQPTSTRAEKDISPASIADPDRTVPSAKPAAGTTAKAAEVSAPVALTKQVRELTPQQRAENEYRKALQTVQQGKSIEAIASLQQALHLDAQHVAARQALVAVLLDNKRTEEAQQVARDGLSLDAEQPGLAMILARLQLEKGEQRAAVETLERTLPYAADRADYLAFLAALLQREGRHKQAIEHYLTVLQKTPQSGVWWMGLGISLQADNRNLEAQEAFKRAKATNTLSAELSAFVDARLNQLRR